MGQMMLTIGALVLLSTAILTMNSGFGSSGELILKSKMAVTAVSLASSIIEEASGKAFDRRTDDSVVTSTSALTPVASLGKETGEVYPDSINDFDDFNNLTKIDAINQGGTFTTKCKVEYVLPANPDVAQTSPTWHKKLTVTITALGMTDTIKAQYIFSYWYFR